MLSQDYVSFRYGKNLPLYEQLRKEASLILEKALQSASIKVHSVSSRVKSLDSFRAKLRRYGKRGYPPDMDDPFSAVGDLVGLRVVCLFLSDLTRIDEVLSKCFQIESKDDKFTSSEVASFGYMAVHYVAALRDQYVGPHYDDIRTLRFEVQVRTIAMDAWASVSHHLDYKTESAIPNHLKRDFHALSGLFCIADRHFEMLAKATEESRSNMAALFGESPTGADQEVNLDSLREYLIRRFPERDQLDPQDMSRLATELEAVGYTTIGQLDDALVVAYPALVAFENGRAGLSDGGAVRTALAILDDRFANLLGYHDPEDYFRSCRKSLRKKVARQRPRG